MKSEFERLQQMYREMDDEHLRDLAEQPEDLTGDARMALSAEMSRRGWTPSPAPLAAPEAVIEEERQTGFGAAIPGIVPAGASAVEQALEPGGELRKGMVRLLSFFDGHELTRACKALEDAAIDFAIEEVSSDAMSGLAPHFEIWIDPADQEVARGTLRQKLGLFPLPEIEGVSADDNDPGSESGDLVVAEFTSTSEAESVRALLAQEGFNARVESDRSQPDTAVVVVPAEQQEQALAIVAERMGFETESTA